MIEHYLFMYNSSTMSLQRGHGTCAIEWLFTYSSMHMWQKRCLHGVIAASVFLFISSMWKLVMQMGHASPANVFMAVCTYVGSIRVGISIEKWLSLSVAWDPHRAACRPAHRARDRPVGRSGSENVGVWQMTCSLLRMGKRSRAPYDDN